MSMYPGTGEYCNACGKVYMYVGDVPDDIPKGQEPWCTCAQRQSNPDPLEGLREPLLMMSDEPSIMHANWCIRCYCKEKEMVGAETIYRGFSLCLRCMDVIIGIEDGFKSTEHWKMNTQTWKN